MSGRGRKTRRHGAGLGEDRVALEIERRKSGGCRIGQHGLLEEGRGNELPGDFLMEMMELNEQIMELDFDFDQEVFGKVSREVIGLAAALEADILPLLQQYPQLEGITKLEALQQVKTYYLKKKYLLRIQQSLSKFASQSHP